MNQILKLKVCTHVFTVLTRRSTLPLPLNIPALRVTRLIQTSSIAFDESAAKKCPRTATAPTKGISHDGDKGETNTLAGIIRPKDHTLLNAIGAVEELSAALGIAKEFAQEASHEYVDKIKRIQTTLIDMCTCLSKYDESGSELAALGHVYTNELEEWIDEYSSQLPPVDQFIIPGGGRAGATLYATRAICRRAERLVVTLVRGKKVDHAAQVYLNRLGDFLFTCARIAAKYDKRTESVYVPRPSVTKPPLTAPPKLESN